MKILITILALFLSIGAGAQQLADLDTFFNHKQFAEVVAMAPKLEAGDEATTAYAYHMAGMSYLELKKEDSAIYCEQQAIDHDHDQTWISAWGYVNLGKVYLGREDKPKALKAFQKAIDLNKTENSVREAKAGMNVIVFGALNKNPALAPKWVRAEGEHIIYYFQDTSAITPAQRNVFIAQHEAAYDTINKIFQATLPTKMVFYVWKDRALAKKVLGHDLGVTIATTCVTNTAIEQTVGHEMTHTFSYWAWGTPTVKATRFINEGTSVAFDLSARDKYEVAQKAIEGLNIRSVLDIWQNEKTNEKILYPVGGAFVSYLYEKSTPEQFRSVIKDQTIENATKTYGLMQFDLLVAEFNKLIGIKQ